MGQLNAAPNNIPLPPVPYNYEFEHVNIQKVKQTPFLRSALYSYEPSIYLQKPDLTLLALLTPRLNTSGLFPQPQVMKLIKCIIQALSFLQSKSINYGDLTTETIYYDRNSKVFKLLNPLLIQKSSYQLTRSGLRFSYLSPQLLLSLSQQAQNVESEIIPKSDVFVFGIILLQVCTLRLSSQIYDPESYNILDTKIQQKLLLIRGYYSQKLCRLVTLMLEYDIEKRLNARQIKKIIQQQLIQQQPQLQQPQLQQPQLQQQQQQIPPNMIKLSSPQRQKLNPFEQILQGSGQKQNVRRFV